MEQTTWLELRKHMRECYLQKEMGVERIHVEGDSLVIVNALMKGLAYSWNINKLILTTCRLLHSFQDFNISHIYCVGNEVVDNMLGLAIS